MPNKPSQGYVKKSISFHPKILEELEAVMAAEHIDNLSGFIQQLVRKELRTREAHRLQAQAVPYGTPQPAPKKKRSRKHSPK